MLVEELNVKRRTRLKLLCSAPDFSAPRLRLEDAILEYTEERKQAKDYATWRQGRVIRVCSPPKRSGRKGREAPQQRLPGQEDSNRGQTMQIARVFS